MPCCSAHVLPAHPGGGSAPSMTRAPAARASAAVPSAERSSTTRTSSRSGSASSPSRHGPRRPSSSRAGTTTETVAPGGGAPSPSGARRTRPPASRLSTSAPAAPWAALSTVTAGAGSAPVLGHGREERDQPLEEVVASRGGRVGVVVGVGRVAVDEHQASGRDVGLARQRPRRVEHALAPQRGAEGVHPQRPRQVVAVRRAHAEHLLGGVGVAVGHRAGVDGQPQRVVPGGAVQALQAPAREHVGEALERGQLAGVVPAARVARGPQPAEVRLGGDERGGRRAGVQREPVLAGVGHGHPRGGGGPPQGPRPAREAGDVPVSSANPYSPALVTGTGGTMSAGSRPEAWPSDGSSGATSTLSEPAELKMPLNGAGMPPNESHGEAARRSARRLVASSLVSGSGLLPPSMYTRPGRPRAPATPPKSHVA